MKITNELLSPRKIHSESRGEAQQKHNQIADGDGGMGRNSEKNLLVLCETKSDGKTAWRRKCCVKKHL